MKPFEAAVVAIYINGIAGALAVHSEQDCMIATDLIDNLPMAMKQFDKISETVSREREHDN